MADGTLFVKVPSTGAAPEDYLVSGAAAIDLLAVRAVFDGTGAGGDFVPVVQIVNEAGEVMLQCVGETVTAGDSASVTFAPFLRTATSSTPPPGGGIQFDTSPQVGDWLEVTTTGAGPSGGGIFFNETGGNDIEFDTAGRFVVVAGGKLVRLQASGAQAELFSNHLKVTGNTDLEVHSSGAETFTGQTFFFQGDHSGSDTLAVDVYGGVNITAGLPGFQGQLAINPDGSVQMDTAAAQIKVDTAGNIILTPLPTLDPGVSGAVWNSGGTLKVSP
jgi:hypothetical protein